MLRTGLGLVTDTEGGGGGGLPLVSDNTQRRRRWLVDASAISRHPECRGRQRARQSEAPGPCSVALTKHASQAPTANGAVPKFMNTNVLESRR